MVRGGGRRLRWQIGGGLLRFEWALLFACLDLRLAASSPPLGSDSQTVVGAATKSAGASDEVSADSVGSCNVMPNSDLAGHVVKWVRKRHLFPFSVSHSCRVQSEAGW